MMDEIIDVEFTPALREFLIRRGYTHILYKGADESEPAPESSKDSHWLIPAKGNDTGVINLEAGYLTVEIKDHKVQLMSEGKSIVQFMIKMPVAEHIVFLKNR